MGGSCKVGEGRRTGQRRLGLVIKAREGMEEDREGHAKLEEARGRAGEGGPGFEF